MFQCHSPQYIKILVRLRIWVKLFSDTSCEFWSQGEHHTTTVFWVTAENRQNISRRNTVLNLIWIADGSSHAVGSYENISDLEIGNTTIRTQSFQPRGKMPSKICFSYLAKIYVTRSFYLFVYQQFYTTVRANRKPSCHWPVLSLLLITCTQLPRTLIIASYYHIIAT